MVGKLAPNSTHSTRWFSAVANIDSNIELANNLLSDCDLFDIKLNPNLLGIKIYTKLLKSQAQLELITYVPGWGYFCAVPSQNGDKFVTSPSPPNRWAGRNYYSKMHNMEYLVYNNISIHMP